MLKRKYLLIIAFTLIIVALNISKCFADADVTAPTIHVDTLKASQTEVGIGDKVTVSVKVTDDIAMSADNRISIYYKTPQTGKSESYYAYYNSENDRYEKTFTIDNSFEAGIWKINYIAAGDRAENYIFLHNEKLTTTNNDKADLSAGNFTVYGTNADVTKPTVYVDTLQVSQTEAEIGDKVTVSVKVTDDIAMSADNRISIYYKTPQTGKSESYYAYYNSENDRYEKTFTIDNSFEAGIWKINYIAAGDRAENYIFLHNEKLTTTNNDKADLSAGDFTVYGTNADVTKPTIYIDTLQVSQTEAETGDKVKISIKVTDDVAMPSDNSISIIYKMPQTGNTKYYFAYYNSESDRYEKTITINDSFEAGTWKINYIYAIDKAGNSASIHNSKIVSYGTKADLSAGDFTIKADSEAFKAELATITELNGIQVYTTNTTVSNTTINGDVYIGPKAIVTLSNVTVNGDIYVLGGLKLSSVNVNAVHAKTMQWSSSGGYSYTNGMFTISGSNTISSTECSDYPVTYIPYKLNRDSINVTDGKLHINGITLDIADFYINDTKINTSRGGKFIADNIDLGGLNIITLKWVTVFGNTITKTYCIEDIVGDVNFDGKVNITDVALINAHVKKTKVLTGDELERADVNDDGKVNITDVALVNAHVKKVKPLPTPKTDKEKAEEIINKYLNNGTLEANAIRPNANKQAEIETFYYSSIYDDFIDLDELKNDLSNQNMSLQLSYDNIPSDYSSFTIKVYKTENGQTTDEITEMTIPINYKTVDQNVLDKSEALIQKIKTNGVIPEGWDVDEYYGFYLEDLELVNYYTSCGITKDTVRTKEQTGKSLNYLDCLATNDNEMSYYLDAREGDDYLLNEDYGGFANVLYNGIKVGAIDLVGVIEKNVIHIPAETENTKEAYIEAATQKLKERFGDDVSVTEGGLRSSLDLSSAIESGWSWNRLGDESLMGDYYYNITVNGYTNQFVIVKEASEPADPSELIKTENVIITKSDKSSEEIENMYPNACSTLPENYEEVLILGIPKFLDVEGNEIEPIGGEGETGVQLYEIDNTRDYTGCTMIITFTKYVGESVDMPDFGTLTYKDSTRDQWYTYYNYQVSITSNDFKKNDGEWTYYEIQQTNIETNETYKNHLFFKFRGETTKTDKEKAEEIINKYLNNGTLDANAIAPDGNKQEEVEIFYYKSIEDDFLNKEEMKNELNNENMTLQLSYDNVPSDYSTFIVKVYKVENNLPTDLITEITIPINYKTVDQNKIAYANAAISKIDAFKVELGESLYGYKLGDLDLVNYYTSCGITKDIDRTQDQYGEALNYIPDTKMGAEDMTFYFDVREGDAFAINEDYGGFAIVLNNGIKIGACQTFVVENNIIYIPDETENTSEAYMEAATQRLKERFGDDVNISEAGLISDFADIQEPLAEGWINLGDESLRGDYYYNVTVNGYTNYFVIMRDSSKINN